MTLPATIDIETKFDLTGATPKFKLKCLTPFTSEGITLTNVKANFKIVNPLGVTVWNNVSTVTPDLYSMSITGITRSGTTATATASTSHGMSTGDWVLIAGADQAGYNILAQVTKVSATVFTYTVDSGTVTPATGTILGLKMSLNTISIPTETGSIFPIAGGYTVTITTIVAGATQAGTYVKDFSYTYNYVRPTVAVTQSVNCFIPRFISTDSTTYMVSGIQPTITRTHNITFPAASSLPVETFITQTVQINSPKVWNGIYTTSISSYLLYTFSDDLVVYDRTTGADSFTVACDANLCGISCCLNTLNQTYNNQIKTNPSAASATLEILTRAIQLTDLYTMNIQCGNSDAANSNLAEIYEITGCSSDCGCDESGQIVPISGYIGRTILDWTDYSSLGVSQYDYVQFENNLYQALENILPNQSPETNPEKYQAIGSSFDSYITDLISDKNGNGTTIGDILAHDKAFVWQNTFSGTTYYYKLTPENGFLKISRSIDNITFEDVVYIDRNTSGSNIITTGNSSTAGVSQFGVSSDNGGLGILTVFGSTNSSTGFGVTQANYLRLRGSGASLAGLIIGLSVNKPIIFGRGNTKDIAIPVGGIIEYANNAAALSGGLTAGDIFRTGNALQIVT